jgi:hypothetical protein
MGMPDVSVLVGRRRGDEGGFRFFPRFYRHVTDIMKRIPHLGNRTTAASRGRFEATHAAAQRPAVA